MIGRRPHSPQPQPSQLFSGCTSSRAFHCVRTCRAATRGRARVAQATTPAIARMAATRVEDRVVQCVIVARSASRRLRGAPLGRVAPRRAKRRRRRRDDRRADRHLTTRHDDGRALAAGDRNDVIAPGTRRRSEIAPATRDRAPDARVTCRRSRVASAVARDVARRIVDTIARMPPTIGVDRVDRRSSSIRTSRRVALASYDTRRVSAASRAQHSRRTTPTLTLQGSNTVGARGCPHLQL